MTRPEWIEAGAGAILGEEATSTSGYYASSYRVDTEHCHDLAREVIAAVEPLIRAKIAADIEAGRDNFIRVTRSRPGGDRPLSLGDEMFMHVYDDAARIARGES